jgi:hypothetical protein
MRTWKQGAVGRIDCDDGTPLFVRCLKFPTAQIYRLYGPINSVLGGWICTVNLDISALRPITRLEVRKVSKSEVREGSPLTGEPGLSIHELNEKVKVLEQSRGL